LKNPKGRLYRWSVHLSTFKFEVIHRAGSAQQHVDALSRAPIVCHLTFDELIDAQNNSDMSFVRNPVIRRGITTIFHRKQQKAVVPESLRPELLKRMHDEYG